MIWYLGAMVVPLAAFALLIFADFIAGIGDD